MSLLHLNFQSVFLHSCSRRAFVCTCTSTWQLCSAGSFANSTGMSSCFTCPGTLTNRFFASTISDVSMCLFPLLFCFPSFFFFLSLLFFSGFVCLYVPSIFPLFFSYVCRVPFYQGPLYAPFSSELYTPLCSWHVLKTMIVAPLYVSCVFMLFSGGSFSQTNASTCTRCSPGFFSLASASSCIACPAGRFQNVSG